MHLTRKNKALILEQLKLADTCPKEWYCSYLMEDIDNMETEELKTALHLVWMEGCKPSSVKEAWKAIEDTLDAVADGYLSLEQAIIGTFGPKQPKQGFEYFTLKVPAGLATFQFIQEVVEDALNEREIPGIVRKER